MVARRRNGSITSYMEAIVAEANGTSTMAHKEAIVAEANAPTAHSGPAR